MGRDEVRPREWPALLSLAANALFSVLIVRSLARSRDRRFRRAGRKARRRRVCRQGTGGRRARRSSAIPRAVPVLKALRRRPADARPRGRRADRPDGRWQDDDADATRPAARQSPISTPTASTRSIVNNRLRGEIEAALGELTLFSPTARRGSPAAADALKHPSADDRGAAGKGHRRAKRIPKSARRCSGALRPASCFPAPRRSSSPRCARSAPAPIRRSSSLLDELRDDPEHGSRRAEGRRRSRSPRSRAACSWSASSPTCSRASASAACCCSPRSALPSPSA